jgi:hypothetical protein
MPPRELDACAAIGGEQRNETQRLEQASEQPEMCRVIVRDQD